LISDHLRPDNADAIKARFKLHILQGEYLLKIVILDALNILFDFQLVQNVDFVFKV
jgi:hypothetical protein